MSVESLFSAANSIALAGWMLLANEWTLDVLNAAVNADGWCAFM